jgi:hypothetical protein
LKVFGGEGKDSGSSFKLFNLTEGFIRMMRLLVLIQGRFLNRENVDFYTYNLIVSKGQLINKSQVIFTSREFIRDIFGRKRFIMMLVSLMVTMVAVVTAMFRLFIIVFVIMFLMVMRVVRVVRVMATMFRVFRSGVDTYSFKTTK